jgi:hypothetical protein
MLIAVTLETMVSRAAGADLSIENSRQVLGTVLESSVPKPTDIPTSLGRIIRTNLVVTTRSRLNLS